MFRTFQVVAIAALAAGVGTLVPGAPAGDKVKAEAGFTSLFDGKDMKGWKFFPEELEKGVTVADGVIVVKGRPNGYFYTAKSYKN